MEHAHNLYKNAVRFLNSGNKQSINQSDIAKGTTYYSRQWTLKQKISLIKNYPALKRQFDNGQIIAKRKNIKIIDLKQA